MSTALSSCREEHDARQRAVVDAAEALQRRKAEKAAALGPALQRGSPDTTAVRIRLKDGSSHQRVFAAQDPLQVQPASTTLEHERSGSACLSAFVTTVLHGSLVHGAWCMSSFVKELKENPAGSMSVAGQELLPAPEGSAMFAMHPQSTRGCASHFAGNASSITWSMCSNNHGACLHWQQSQARWKSGPGKGRPLQDGTHVSFGMGACHVKA